MRLSNTKIATWKRCWKKYEYRYVKGLKSKEVARPPRLGRLGHAGIEAFLKDKDWKEEINNLWEEELSDIPSGLQDGQKQKDLNLIKVILERFFDWHDYYRSEDEENILEPEYEFEVDIPYTDDTLYGYFDQVIKVPDEGIWLIDHKFTTSSPENKLDKLELNEQIDYYMWALNKMFPDETLQGAIFTAILLKTPTKPEPIKSGKRLSKRKIKTDYQTYMEAIKENGFDPSDYQEKLQKLKQQKNPFFQRKSVIRDEWELKNIGNELRQLSVEMGKTNQFIRSRGGRCDWDCDYKDLCMAEKKGGDVEALIDSEYTTREERHKNEQEEKDKKEMPF